MSWTLAVELLTPPTVLVMHVLPTVSALAALQNVALRELCVTEIISGWYMRLNMVSPVFKILASRCRDLVVAQVKPHM